MTDRYIAGTAAQLSGQSIMDFAKGDELDVLGLDPTRSAVTAQYDADSRLLQILQNGVEQTSLTLAADLAGAFTVTTDYDGGAIIQLSDPTQDYDATAIGTTTAQAAYGLDGSGVIVGVISGGFNTLGGMAQDIANNDLPSATTVLSDAASPNSDEGREMAQLIHQGAPGAAILFAQEGSGDEGMAQAVDELVQHHAKVIVDDVEVLSEAFWQPGGPLDQAIDAAAAQGVVFLTAAGNSGSGYYTSPFSLAAADLPGGIGQTYAVSFDGGEGVEQYLQKVTVGNDGDHSFALQWDQPRGQSSYSLTLHVLRLEADGSFEEVGRAVPLTNGVAGEITHFSGSGTFYIAITSATASAAGLLEYKINNNGRFVSISGSTTGDVYGDISGHRLNPNEITVGEASYKDTPAFGDASPTNLPSSDYGPGAYLFDASGQRLASPAILGKPDVTAAVGSATDVSGTLQPFSGTSAAAPNVAAAVALMLQANPNLTPAQIEAALQASAYPMAGSAAGAGLVQADQAVALVMTPYVTAVSVTPSVTGAPLHAGDTLTVTLTANTALTAAVTAGLPTVSLSDGGTATFDAAASGPTSLVFQGTVAAGEDSGNLSVTALNLNGGSFTNAAGLALPASGLGQASGAVTGLVVDTTTTGVDLYDGYTQSVLLPFAPGSGLDNLSGADPLADRIRLPVSVNGAPTQNYVIDTGSLGVTAPDTDFTQAQLAAGQPGTIIYGSSGLELLGVWVTTTLTFTDSAGNPVTESLPVLAVSEVVDASTGAPTGDAIPRMLGVKYAPVTGVSNLDASNNAFLNLPGMQDGTMRAGYIIDASGVTLGLTTANAGSGWAYGQLTQASPASGASAPLWQPAVTTITAAGGAPTQGTELVDTGLTRSFVNGSGATVANLGQDGTTVAVDLLGTGTGTVGYQFAVGGSDAWTPSKVQYDGRTTDFINTGSRALLAVDYLVDATGGYIGFRAKPDAGSGVAFTPVLALGGSIDPTQAVTTTLPAILRADTSVIGGAAVTLAAVSGDHALAVGPGASLTLSADGSYSGGTTLDGGTLTLWSSGAAGSGAIAFAPGAASTLALAAGVAPANAITGFDAGDVIDLAGVDPNSAMVRFDAAQRLMQVSDAAGHTIQLSVATDEADPIIRLARDAGGSGIAVSAEEAPCYCPGTLIRTERGEVAVEELAIGDRVVTGTGALMPIRWLGRRSYSGRFVAGRSSMLPVCIRAGALAEATPHRDLWVSPLHAMLLDGHLVPAGLLVNGRSIVQAESVRQLDYIHIELDSHATIWAEGAESESFLDDGSRGMFHNAADYATLYPPSDPSPARGSYCAPRLSGGSALQALRDRLSHRAAREGERIAC